MGDHKQLPAVVRQKEHISAVNEPLLQNIELLNCRESLFERLLRLARKRGYNNVIGTLRFQGRMHPEVASFASNMFYGSEQLDIVPLKHQLEASLKYEKPSLDALDDALKAHRVMFFPSQRNIVAGQSDKVNEQEAYMVATLLSRIYRQYGDAFDAQKTVGVIVPYRNQIAKIRHSCIAKHFYRHGRTLSRLAKRGDYLLIYGATFISIVVPFKSDNTRKWGVYRP